MAQEKPELKKTYGGGYVSALDIAKNKGHDLIVTHLPSGLQVLFGAFLENWNDSFTSSWNREQVYGRMDPIQNFQGTQRTISVSFKLVSATFAEAKRHLRAVSELAQFLYPSYASVADGILNGYAITGAPILSIKYMNLITEADGSALAGTLDGLDHSFDQEGGFFEDASQVYPKIINLSFTFHPLHKSTQGYVNGNTPLNDGFPYVNSGYTTDPPAAFDVAEDNPDSDPPPAEVQESTEAQVLQGGMSGGGPSGPGMTSAAAPMSDYNQ